jgi:glycosyltransferase involved in cell wall biosynthesis
MSRILLVHYTFPGVIGGVEMVLARHAEALRDAGATVTIAAGRGRASIRGVHTLRIPELDSRHPAVDRVFQALAAGEVPDELEPLRARIRARLAPEMARSDRVVVHNVTTLHKNFALALALRDLASAMPRGKLIVWVHDLAWTDARYLRQRHPGEPWDSLARPIAGAQYVAVSAARRDETATLLGLAPDTIDVVPNGIDLAEVLRLGPRSRALIERLGLADATVLLLPARLTRRKRIEVAIDAAGLLARRGRRVRLVVTGGPGPHNAENARYLEELRSRVRASQGAAILLHDVIGRALPHRAVMELLALADALVFPSEHEGFGIPLLEAAALHVPLVVSDIPAHRALVAADAAYVAPNADADTLADTIEHVLAGDTAARRRTIAREHEWSRVLAERVVPLILGPRAQARRSA